MTTRRFYANDAPQQTLATGINSAVLSLTVQSSFAGWPTQFPFFATLEIGTANREIVSVTNIVGLVATIVRGQDGTAAIGHTAGATIDMTVIRQDLDEANAHTSANTGVHGVAGAVVGTTDAQTLSNKTIASPTLTGTAAGASLTLSGTAAVTGAATAASFIANGNGVVGGVIAPKSYANEAAAGSLPAGDVVYLSAPTGAACVAGLYVSQGAGVWFPLNPTAKDFLSFVPGGSLATPGAGTATWVTMGNLTVPAWATKARIQINLSGLPPSTAGSAIGCAIKLGAVTGGVQRITAQSAQRWQFSIADQLVGLASGALSLTLQATFVVGTMTADAVSFLQAAVDYLP